jgi:NADH-quinone oxidoreductase subunit M
LFFTVGFIQRRHGTVLISQLRGLERATPVLAGLFLVAGLATMGLPGLSQFVSEMLVLISAFDYHWWVGAVAVTGIVLAAVYVLWAYQRVFTGPDPAADPEASVGDVTRREAGVLAPLVLALVVFGFVPGPLIEVANPTVSALMEHVGVTDQAPEVAGGGN